MPTTLAQIFRDSETHHRLSLFDQPVLKAIEALLFEKNGKPHIKCLATDKDRPAKPEEIVRQLWIHKLINQYGYPKSRLAIEHPVKFGSETKRADIVVFDKERVTVEYIIVELKKTRLKDGKDQLKSYCNATGAPIGVWSNGEQYSFYNRKDPNYFNDLTEIPAATQSLKASGKYETAVGRDLLFIERNLDFLKPGGRMAVVLPQGRFNNASDKALRDYIGERCRILAVVGLHGNTFKPHTGTKTSVLFVQKWTDEQKAKREAIRNKHLAEFKKHFAELEENVELHQTGVPDLGRAILAEELGGEKDDEELAKEKKDFSKHLSAFTEDALESEANKLELKAKSETFPKARYAIQAKADKMRRELARRGGRWALWYLVEYLSHEYQKQWLAKKAVGTELDYAIFFATQRKPGKDTSGDKIFVKRPAPPKSETKAITATQEAMPLQEVPDTYNAEPPTGDYLLDLHGHLIVDHDLFNHDGLTQDGIAEAFQEFAKKEKLSFF